MLSNKKRIATYTIAATAALSGGVGTLLAVLADGAGAQSTGTTAPAAAAAPDPGGRPGRPGRPDDGARVDVLAVAAQAIGTDAATLRTALEGGSSIAAVAKDKGVVEQKVIDAIVAARTKAMDDAVAAGRLTADEASKRKADLPAHVKEEVERVGLRGPGGPDGDHHGRPDRGGPPAQGSSTTGATPSSTTTD